MGLLDAGIDILTGLKKGFSDDPFDSGLRFEDYVDSMMKGS